MKQNSKTNIKVSQSDLWDEIGFHRPLAGFWYNLLFTLLMMILSGVFSGFLLNYMYPFPEAIGYRDVVAGLFSLIFTIFDLGTHLTMSRYIAESQIKNPSKVILYVQYFIWYQMITGLIQVTIISIYALYFVPESSLSYTVWLMLILGSKQFPGFLGVFRNTLKAMQQYNKVAILNFISSEVFQRLTEFGFVLLGRWYGINHPEIGEIMGIAIGSIIGLYVDDFLATLVSAKFFSSLMKEQGIKAKDCFRIDFDWKLAKEVFLFGIRTGISSLTGTIANFVILNLYLEFLPQYTTFKALMMVASAIGGILSWAYEINITPQLSESYLNDKKHLAQYHFSQAIRFAALIQGFLLSLIIIVYQILPTIFTELKLDNYMLGLVFIPPLVMNKLFQPYLKLTDQGLAGTNNPTAHMIITTITDFFKIVEFWVYLAWLNLPEKYGSTAIVLILTVGELPCYFFQFFAGHLFIHLQVFKIRVPWKQVLISIPGASLITFGVLYVERLLFFDLFYYQLDQFWLGLILFAVISIFSIIFLYFPLTGFLGGWDEYTMEDFRKSADMSGPSKFLVGPMYNMVKFGADHCIFKSDFSLPMQDAMDEAKELIEIRKINRDLSQINI